MNIFEYLDYYTQTNSQSYGSIGKDKETKIREMLSNQEYEQYKNIQQMDRNRLIRFS